MTGIVQRDHRDAFVARLGKPELDALRRDGLAETELPIGERKRLRLADDLQFLIRHDLALAQHPDVTRRAHHTMAVMPGEARADQIARDAATPGDAEPAIAQLA